MALSKNTTAAKLWRQAISDLNVDQNSRVITERFDLINRAVEMVAGLFYDLMEDFYKTEVTGVSSTTGRYGPASGTPTWTASTSTLVVVMDSDFVSSDVGNLVLMREGTSVYVGTIASFISTTSVTLQGDNLPTSNISGIDAVVMAGTSPTSDTLSLANLKIMRVGQQLHLEVDSTVTDFIEFLTPSAFKSWRSSAQGNKNKIVCSLVGDDLKLAKGSSLSSYGTLTVRFPRVPTSVTLDTQYVDIPDGVPMEIATMKLKALVAQRAEKQLPDQSARISELVDKMYKTYGMSLSSEKREEVVEALK